MLDYEKISAQLKEKLGGEEGALEEVPFEHLCQHFAGVIRAQEKGHMVVFDGWNYGTKELQRLFEVAGNPKNIVNFYLFFIYGIDFVGIDQGKCYEGIQEKKRDG